MNEAEQREARALDRLAAGDFTAEERRQLRELYREHEFEQRDATRRERERPKDEPDDHHKLRILWDERAGRVESRSTWWERLKGMVVILGGVSVAYGLYTALTAGAP